MESFSKSKENYLKKVKMKIKHLKSNMKQHQTKPALCDGLHRRFVIVTIDKAANNFALKIHANYIIRNI